MVSSFNEQEVRNSLGVVDRLLNRRGINYRLIGSVVMAAINRAQYREIGDLDLLLGKNDWGSLSVNLRKAGFRIVKRRKAGFSWFEASKPRHAALTFLLLGEFGSKYFSCRLNRASELVIANDFIKPTKYRLYGVGFIGVPKSSVYEGVRISGLNPKRQMDKRVLLQSVGSKSVAGPKIRDSFRVKVLGLEAPYLYLAFSWLYNLYGGLRVLLGKKYEVW